MVASHIKNYRELARDTLRADALAILEAGYEAIDNERVIKKRV